MAENLVKFFIHLNGIVWHSRYCGTRRLGAYFFLGGDELVKVNGF